MQTQVTFRHCRGDHPDLHATAEKLAESLTKYNDNISNVKVEFMNDTEKIVEFVVFTQGTVLASKEASDDFHKSLNSAYDKMLRQIQKRKQKNI